MSINQNAISARKLSQFTLAFIVAFATSAVAQEQGPEQGAVIKTDSGVDLLPALNTGFKHDDNITRVADNKLSSWIFTIAPSVKATLLDGTNSYTMTAAVKDAVYFSSNPDEYTDGYWEGEAKFSADEAQKFSVKANRSWLHEDRGTGISEGRGNLQSAVTKYNSTKTDFDYEYGSDGSRGKLKLNGRLYSKEFENFRDVTVYRDYDYYLGGAGFFYQMEGSYSLFIEANQANIQYAKVDPSGDRNSLDTNYRAGVEWEISSVTTGTVKAGYQDKNFDLLAREDFHGFAWEAILLWQPLTYSGFDIATGRRAKDVDSVAVVGDYIVETTYGLGWNHEWSELWSTKLAYEFQTNEYNITDRKDIARVATVELNGDLLRWMKVKGFFNHEIRTSNAIGFGYDRNVVGIEFNFTL